MAIKIIFHEVPLNYMNVTSYIYNYFFVKISLAITQILFTSTHFGKFIINATSKKVA